MGFLPPLAYGSPSQATFPERRVLAWCVIRERRSQAAQEVRLLHRPPPLIFPPELDPIAYIIGFTPAMVLARRSAGVPVWIPHPRWLDHDQLVVDALGLELARELCEEMGGQYWQPPNPEEAGRPLDGNMVLTMADLLQWSPSRIAEEQQEEESRIHALLTATAIWYKTGDLELASQHAGEPPWFLSMMLNYYQNWPRGF